MWVVVSHLNFLGALQEFGSWSWINFSGREKQGWYKLSKFQITKKHSTKEIARVESWHELNFFQCSTSVLLVSSSKSQICNLAPKRVLKNHSQRTRKRTTKEVKAQSLLWEKFRMAICVFEWNRIRGKWKTKFIPLFVTASAAKVVLQYAVVVLTIILPNYITGWWE